MAERGAGAGADWRAGVAWLVRATVLSMLACGSMRSQTLARPGWAGSGMAVERWWHHAVMVEVLLPATADGAAEAERLRWTTERLDRMRGVGANAVLLRGFPDARREAAGADATGASDALDDLLREASRRSMRVLVEVPGDRPEAELGGISRTWLNRGIAGIAVAGGGDDALRVVRNAVRLARGDRLLVRETAETETAPGGPPITAAGDAAPTRAGVAELRMVRLPGLRSQGSAAALRGAIERAAAGGRGGLMLLAAGDAGASGAAMVRVAAAAVLLSTPGAALLGESAFGAEEAVEATTRPADEHSAAAQVRRLSALHSDRAPFLLGTTTTLDHDAEGAVVWLRRGPGGAVLVVVGNVSAQLVRLSLVEDMARLRLRGTFLKTISRSDSGLGAMPLAAVEVPAGGVYVGELAR